MQAQEAEISLSVESSEPDQTSGASDDSSSVSVPVANPMVQASVTYLSAAGSCRGSSNSHKSRFRISVEDTGAGISEGIMDSHFGTICVHSAGEGHGCIFVVEIPLHHRHSPSSTDTDTAYVINKNNWDMKMDDDNDEDDNEDDDEMELELSGVYPKDTTTIPQLTSASGRERDGMYKLLDQGLATGLSLNLGTDTDKDSPVPPLQPLRRPLTVMVIVIVIFLTHPHTFTTTSLARRSSGFPGVIIDMLFTAADHITATHILSIYNIIKLNLEFIRRFRVQITEKLCIIKHLITFARDIQ
eukprot:gene3907-7791_t